MSEGTANQVLLFERTGAVARITLNRPEKLNAIDHELGLRLYEAFARCEGDPEVHAIVLAGTGREALLAPVLRSATLAGAASARACAGA